MSLQDLDCLSWYAPPKLEVATDERITKYDTEVYTAGPNNVPSKSVSSLQLLQIPRTTVAAPDTYSQLMKTILSLEMCHRFKMKLELTCTKSDLVCVLSAVY